jgi:DNA-binding MarR family transcriptional regulator
MAATIQQIFKETTFINEQHVSMAGLLHIGSVVDRHIAKTLEQYNLPLNKYQVLRGLRKVHPEGVGVYKLRDFVVDQKSDISRLVERMVQRGLVERSAKPNNKSISQIVITDKGLQLANEIDKHTLEIIAPAMCLSDTEARQLNVLLEKILAAFPNP